MKHPDGKISPDDQGEQGISIYMAETEGKKTLIINFGKDLSWIGFDKKTCSDFIKVLQKKLKEFK